MKANTWKDSKIPRPTLVTRHRKVVSKEGSHVGRPLNEISNEANLESKNRKPNSSSQFSVDSQWKTVKPDIVYKSNQYKEDPGRKVRERLEAQESKMEQVEQATKSYEEQQRHYQQQMKISLENMRDLEEQIIGVERIIKELEDEALSATNELERIQESKREKEKHLDQLKVERSVVEGQMQVEVAKTQSMQRNMEEVRAILSNIYEEQLSLQKQIQSEKCKIQDELHQIEELCANEEYLETEVERLKEQKEQYVKLLTEQEGEREEKVRELERLKEDCLRQQKELLEKQEQEHAIEKEIADLELQEQNYPKRKEELQQEIAHLKKEMNAIEVRIQQYKAQLVQKENEYKATQEMFEELRDSSEKALLFERRNLSSTQSQLEESKEKNEQLCQAIRKKHEEAEYFESALDQQRTLLVSLRNKLSTLELKLDEERNVYLIEKQKLDSIEERMHRQQSIIAEMKEQRQNNEAIQEALQRQVYEMRPNMQVFCKLYNCESNTGPQSGLVQQLQLDIQNSEVVASKIQNSQEPSISIFPFDQVFDTNASNEQIFRHCVAFVDQAWKERDVCIFGYAMHPHLRKLFFDMNQGLTFLSLLHLLENRNNNSQSTITLVIQFFKIWNDELEDILSSTWKETEDTRLYKDDDKRDATNQRRDLTAIEISDLSQLQEQLISRIDFQMLESQLGHFVFQVSIKDKSLQSSDTRSTITYIHAQAPDIYNKETVLEKNFVSLLQLLTQLTNREKHVSSCSSTSILSNKIFECFSDNPKLLSILQIPKTTENIQSAFQLLNLGQKLNCCEITAVKATSHR